MVGAAQLEAVSCAGGGIHCPVAAVISIRPTPSILLSSTSRRCFGAVGMITSVAGHALPQGTHRRKLVFLPAALRSLRKHHLYWKVMLQMCLLIFPPYPGNRMTPRTLPLNRRISRNSLARCSAVWTVPWKATKGIFPICQVCLKINMTRPLAPGMITWLKNCPSPNGN